MPHKRYVRSDVLALSKRYLDSSLQSKRGILWDGKSLVGYENQPDSFLYLSTVRRWVMWPLKPGEIDQKSPGSDSAEKPLHKDLPPGLPDFPFQIQERIPKTIWDGVSAVRKTSGTIDLLMMLEGMKFVEAVYFLEKLLPESTPH